MHHIPLPMACEMLVGYIKKANVIGQNHPKPGGGYDPTTSHDKQDKNRWWGFFKLGEEKSNCKKKVGMKERTYPMWNL